MKTEQTPLSRRLLIGGLAIFATATVVGSQTASAQLTLDQARNQGLVGERRNGLLGIVQNSGGVAALVDQINAQRLAQYQQVANSNGTSLAAVQQLAGAQLIDRARSGWYVESGSGGWVQK
ncbi:MAG: YdbL family protein [Pseudomonadota bacterium]